MTASTPVSKNNDPIIRAGLGKPNYIACPLTHKSHVVLLFAKTNFKNGACGMKPKWFEFVVTDPHLSLLRRERASLKEKHRPTKE